MELLTREEIKEILPKDWFYFSNEVFRESSNPKAFRQKIYVINTEKEIVHIYLKKLINDEMDFALSVELEKISEQGIVETSRLAKRLLERAMDKDQNKIRNALKKEPSIQYQRYCIDLEKYEVPFSDINKDDLLDTIEDTIDTIVSHSSSPRGPMYFWVIGEKGRWFKDEMGKKGFVNVEERGENVWGITFRSKLFSGNDKQKEVTEGIKRVLNKNQINAFHVN